MIEINNLSKSYGINKIFENESITLTIFCSIFKDHLFCRTEATSLSYHHPFILSTTFLKKFFDFSSSDEFVSPQMNLIKYFINLCCSFVISDVFYLNINFTFNFIILFIYIKLFFIYSIFIFYSHFFY